MKMPTYPCIQVGLLTLLAILITPSAFTQTVLTYSDHEPLGNMRTRFINDHFFSAVEKESGGSLKIVPHWNAELSSGYEALKNVGRIGNGIDIAVVVPEYDEKNLPKHQLFKSFATGFGGGKQVNFLRETYRSVPELDKELNEQNAVRLFIATGYPVGFFSPNKLNGINNLHGRWRTASFWHADHLTHAGAEPVKVPWGKKVTEGLADGSLEGVMVNIDSARDIAAHQTAPNALVSPQLWLGHIYLITINKDSWNALSESERQAFIRAAEMVYPQLGAYMDSHYAQMVATLRQEGVNLRELSETEIILWQTLSDYQQTQLNWVKKKENEGVQELSNTLEKITALWTKYAMMK